MYLTSLEIGGFKSFAKKSDLEFTTAITAIVGPNGSGKSNVAEAFRFVLGEQSVKSMRGKKGEDLIWGGSHAVARMNRASVKITLNNEARVFPLDFDEIVVERAVHRDGVNEYAINGSRVRLRDVQELLAAANIGPTGHHIISQGEADRILSASAKERREMIEDALGLKVYQYKKAESEKKLAKTVENIAQIESLRREVAPHLRFLAGQVKKIEKSIQLREELSRVYCAYLKRESLYLAHHEERLAGARVAPEAELAALERELAAAKATLAAGEQDDKRDALVALEEKIRALGTRRQDALRESGRVEGQLGYIERALADAQRAREREVRAPISFAEVERVVDSVERLSADAGTIADVTGMRRLVESMVRTLRSFLNETSRVGTEAPEQARMEAERATLERERKLHEETLATIAGEERVLRGEYDALRASIEAEASESREAEREVFRIMGRQRELSELLSTLTREATTLARDREEFNREIQEAVALIGREVAGYGECTADSDGRSIVAEEVYAEARTVQLERRRQLEKMKIRLEELGGAGGDEVMKEYKEVGERDAFLAREITDLEQSVVKLEALIADLTAELNEQFVAGIDKIGAEFNRFFILMFGGGKAALVRTKPKPKKRRDDFESLLEDDVPEETEEVEEGIDLDVALPNKRVRGLEMLSGGERALTSIALIFAMSQVNPPLFVILDETDAALDEANSRRYGDMIEALAKRSQLILITHNRETMSRAGVLYGVTMGGDGVSKLLSVKFDEAVAVAK